MVPKNVPKTRTEDGHVRVTDEDMILLDSKDPTSDSEAGPESEGEGVTVTHQAQVFSTLQDYQMVRVRMWMPTHHAESGTGDVHGLNAALKMK